MMKPLTTRLFAWAILFLISMSFTWPVHAQTVAEPSGSTGRSSYDSTEEVTLTGRISSVLTKAAPGMVAGSHLLLATSSGLVDASLGRFALSGSGTPGLRTGQEIEVRGVMRTRKDGSFLLVRTVKVDGEAFAIRNEHGFPLSEQARARARQKTERKGESQ
jgi:hypothetical protein